MEPHPLAITLAACARISRVLLIGLGNGRNLPPFAERKLEIVAVDESPTKVSKVGGICRSVHVAYTALPFAHESFDAVLSTHALQHGDLPRLEAMLAELARVTAAEGSIALALTSTADSRYGRGRRIGPQCYAPVDGDEIGIAHVYVTKRQALDLLAPHFEVHSCDERGVDDIAGAWAHSAPRGMRHFFITATRKATLHL